MNTVRVSTPLSLGKVPRGLMIHLNKKRFRQCKGRVWRKTFMTYEEAVEAREDVLDFVVSMEWKGIEVVVE